MDRIPGQIEIEFAELHADQSDLADASDILLRIVGRFRLTATGRIIFEEDDFTVVEFAAAVSKWLDRVHETRDDFEFESMEAEEIGSIYVKKRGSQWEIGSIFQQNEVACLFTLDEVVDAFRDYLSRLSTEVRRVFSIDIGRFLRTASIRDE